MNKIAIKVSALLFVMSLSTTSVAATAVEQLNTLLQGFKQYSANFEQYSKDDQGRKGEISTGVLSVARPDKFRWETVSPFPQLIVSDGKVIWIYDEDLEQATQKALLKEESNGAALILNGNTELLSKKFTISLLVNNNSEKLFQLVPKVEGNFEKINLFFEKKQMRELMLVDLLGKQTTIILTDAKLNPVFKSELFNFKPPAGTDIIIDSAEQ